MFIFKVFYTPIYAELMAGNRACLALIFKNNKYLLGKSKTSLRGQYRTFAVMGYKSGVNNHSRLFHSKRHSIPLTALQIFSIYWKIPLGVLMSVDLEEQDRVNSSV